MYIGWFIPIYSNYNFIKKYGWKIWGKLIMSEITFTESDRVQKYNDYFKGLYRCKHIHMSYSSNGDGFKRSITHGVTHPNIETVNEDLAILEQLGIKNITMCPEVAEVGDMYCTREQQVKEIKLLDSIHIFG